MQFFELVLIIVTTVYLGFNRFVNKKLSKHYVTGLLVSIIALQLIFNGYRWQMIPAYLIWLIALITAFRQTGHKPKSIIRALKTIGMLVILALSIMLPSILPVFELPQTTGPYTVGTRDLYLELDRE